MTDLPRLSSELREQLGQPPAGWTERQRLRLRGVDLTAQRTSKRPLALAAAFTLAAVLLAFGYTFLSSGSAPTEHASARSGLTELEAGRGNEDSERPDSESLVGKAVWLEAEPNSSTHRLEDGSSIQLEAKARGRLDEGGVVGTRFDLHEGVAFFEIQKQTNRSFSVVAGDYKVIVVGTRFSVAYVPPRHFTVDVSEGAVEVYLPSRPDPVLVHESEELDAVGADFSVKKRNAHLASGDNARGKGASVDDPSTGAGPSSSAVSWQQLYRQGKYQDACREVQGLSSGGLSAATLIDLAGTLRLCGNSGAALGTLHEIRRRFRGSSEAQEALFLIGRIHASAGQNATAVSFLELYLRAPGDGRFAAEALGRLVELHLAEGHKEKARDFAKRYLELAPEGAYRRLTESLVGE